MTFVVVEGAGSAAETNLRERDIATWDSPVMQVFQWSLLADIDRGGRDRVRGWNPGCSRPGRFRP